MLPCTAAPTSPTLCTAPLPIGKAGPAGGFDPAGDSQHNDANAAGIFRAGAGSSSRLSVAMAELEELKSFQIISDEIFLESQCSLMDPL